MTKWPVVRLADVVQCLDSVRRPVRAADRRSGQYPYYGASGVVDHVDDYLFDGTYTLVAEDGENLRTRKTPVAFLVHGKFWVNNHAHILAGTAATDVRYLSYRLENSDVSGFLSGSTQPKLTQHALLSMAFAWPPIDVQRAIAEVLGTLDDKIAANMRIVRLLEERLAALFTTLGLDESGDNLVKLPMLLELNPQRSKANEKVSPYIDMAALPTESALVSTPRTRPSKSGTRFVNGDTVMARITPCLENGKTAYIDCLAEGEVGIGSTEFIVLRPKAGLPVQFAYFLARSPRFRDFAVRHMSGSSGRQRCPAGALARYELSRPTASALAEFAEQVDPSFAMMRAALDESLVLAELRDVLLPRLLSGELHVREADALVGEAV